VSPTERHSGVIGGRFPSGDRSHYYTFGKRNAGARYLVGRRCATQTWEDEALVKKELLLFNEYWREGVATSPVNYM